MSLASDLLLAARAKSLRIATAESCTGGMVGAAITDISGSSTIYERGFITYTNDAKVEMLGVKQTTLDAVGAVSEEVAAQMAQGALRNSHANLAVSITGIAGPGGSDHKPEGRVCFGIAHGDLCHSETVEYGPLGRANVRNAATNHALSLLITAISRK